MRPTIQSGDFQDHNRGPLFHITGVPSSGSWSSIGQGNGWINAGLNNSGVHDHPVNNDNGVDNQIELFKLKKSKMSLTDDAVSSSKDSAALIGTTDADVITFSGKRQNAQGKSGADLFVLDLDLFAESERLSDKVEDISFREGDRIILGSATIRLKGIRLGVSRSKKEFKSLLKSDADLIFKINKKQTKARLLANNSSLINGIDVKDTLLKVAGDLDYNGMIPLEMTRLF